MAIHKKQVHKFILMGFLFLFLLLIGIYFVIAIINVEVEKEKNHSSLKFISCTPVKETLNKYKHDKNYGDIKWCIIDGNPCLIVGKGTFGMMSCKFK